jgi:hypothetical protein
MDTLPVELSTQIAGYLPCRDLASLRLTSKATNTVATPLLFETVPIFLFNECFIWLARLPNEIKANIRRIQFFGYGLPYFGAHGSWHSEASLAFRETVQRATEIELQCAEDKYWAYYFDHLKAFTDPTFNDFFADLFPGLPRISELDFVCNIKDNFSRKIARQCLIRPRPLELLPTRVVRENGQEGLGMTRHEQFNAVLVAAHGVGRKIAKINVDYMRFEEFDRNGDRRSLSSMDGRILASLTHLEHLSLQTRYTKSREYKGLTWHSIPADDDRDCLSRMLAAAQHLKTIRLSFADRFEEGDLFYTWATIIELTEHRKYWPKLEVVDIQGLFASADEIGRLLTRHAASLKEVKLVNVMLKSGSWKKLFDTMRRSLTLRQCTLGSLHIFRPLGEDDDGDGDSDGDSDDDEDMDGEGDGNDHDDDDDVSSEGEFEISLPYLKGREYCLSCPAASCTKDCEKHTKRTREVEDYIVNGAPWPKELHDGDVGPIRRGH